MWVEETYENCKKNIDSVFDVFLWSRAFDEFKCEKEGEISKNVSK